MFKNIPQAEICRIMAGLCQKSADETPPGEERERYQMCSDKFRDEADGLSLQNQKRGFLGF